MRPPRRIIDHRYGLHQRQDFPAIPRIRVWLKIPTGSDATLSRLATELPQQTRGTGEDALRRRSRARGDEG